MPNSRLRVIALALATVGALGVAAASILTPRTACVSTPVAGQPGLHILTCTTARP